MIQIQSFQTASADFTQRIELGGKLVTLRLTWNARVGFFFLDITDPQGVTLYEIKVVSQWPLLKQYAAGLDFEGDLILLKTDEEAGPEVTYDNLNEGFTFYYITEEERDEWEVANGLG